MKSLPKACILLFAIGCWPKYAVQFLPLQLGGVFRYLGGYCYLIQQRMRIEKTLISVSTERGGKMKKSSCREALKERFAEQRISRKN